MVRRRLLVATTAGLAAAVLTACGDMHPGAAVVIDDGDFRASMEEVDDLSTALCEATPLLAEAQGQAAQTSEGIDARQYVARLLIQSYLTEQAAEETGAQEPSPSDYAVSPDEIADVTDQMDPDRIDDFLQVIELGNEARAWQVNIGLELSNGSASNAEQLGFQYVFDAADDYDIDIDPRLGLDADDLQSTETSRSGSMSVAQSSEAMARAGSEPNPDLIESLPPTQTCG
jgi:hypothetical protein